MKEITNYELKEYIYHLAGVETARCKDIEKTLDSDKDSLCEYQIKNLEIELQQRRVKVDKFSKAYIVIADIMSEL